MGDLLFYIAAFIFVIALIIMGAWLWRSMLENGVALPGQTLFKAARDKRIGAIETASIDSRRKLVLIRRDNVEHLIMTGGPVDVVIETNITASGFPRPDSKEPQSSSDRKADGLGGSSLDNRLFSPKRPSSHSSFLSDD